MTEGFEGFEVEDNDSVNSNGYGVVTKLYLSPLYVLRKLLYLAISANCFALDKLSKALGFSFSYEVREKDAWAWLKDWSFPRYKARVERKD